MATLVHLPIIVTFLLRGDTFIGLWMGPEYAEPSGRILWILSLAYWFMAGRQIMVTTLMGLNRHRVLVPAAWVEALCNVGLSVLLLRSIGIDGVAWGTTIPSLVVTVGVYPFLFSKALETQVAATFREFWVWPSLAMIPFAIATYTLEWFTVANSVLGFFMQTAAVLPVALLGAWWIGLRSEERTRLRARLPQLRHRIPRQVPDGV